MIVCDQSEVTMSKKSRVPASEHGSQQLGSGRLWRYYITNLGGGNTSQNITSSYILKDSSLSLWSKVIVKILKDKIVFLILLSRVINLF